MRGGSGMEVAKIAFANMRAAFAGEAEGAFIEKFVLNDNPNPLSFAL
jgi:hypothetical protein